MYLEAQADEYVYEYVYVPDIPYLRTDTYIKSFLRMYFFFSFLVCLYIPYIHTYPVTYLGTFSSLSFAFRKRGRVREF